MGSTPPALRLAPMMPKPGWEPKSLRAKIDAGADFAQTQYCFDLETAKAYFGRLADFGITERLAFLVGIGPLASLRQAKWMDENLFGVSIPEAFANPSRNSSYPSPVSRRTIDRIAAFASTVVASTPIVLPPISFASASRPSIH